jgi:hypothetical protein
MGAILALNAIALVLVVAAALARPDEPTQLFERVNTAAADMPPNQKAAIDEKIVVLTHQAGTVSVNVVRLKPSALDAPAVALNLDTAGGNPLKLNRLSVDVLPGDGKVWKGETADSKRQVDITVRGGKSYSTFYKDGYIYQLVLLSTDNGFRALIKKDPKKVKDHPENFRREVEQKPQKPASNQSGASADLAPGAVATMMLWCYTLTCPR